MTIRFTGMRREGHTEHHESTDGKTVSVRVEYTPEDAASTLVADWLHPVVTWDDEGESRTAPATDLKHISCAKRARVIRDENGNRLGVLVSPEEYDEGRNAIGRINEDTYGTPDSRYKPFQHSPTATTDRIINTERLERILRDAIHGKDADLTEAETDKIHWTALVAALEFSFDPDSRGLVPVMTPSRAADSPHTEYFWSFLYPTPVAGLYLRAEDDIIGAISYTVTTGSGYAIASGFWERDYANELAVKLGEALPGMDWFTTHRGAFTAETAKTATRVIREHGKWRKEDES